MKNLVFGIIAIVLFGFVGSAQSSIPKESLTVDYFNYVFSQTSIHDQVKVIAVSTIKVENYDRLTLAMSKKSFREIGETKSIDVILENEKLTVFIMPLIADNTAVSIVENDRKQFVASFDLKLDQNGNYSVVTIERRRPTKAECKEGASEIQDLATILSLSGFFCPPCGFAGGAVLGITTILKMFCH